MLHKRSLLRANATRAAGLIVACIGLMTYTQAEVAADVPEPDPWGNPTPPPLFELSHDYPTVAKLPVPLPWRDAIGNEHITTDNADAYVQALKDYIAEDMKVLLFDYANWDAGKRGWYNQPWLASTRLSDTTHGKGAHIREPIHGTYIGSADNPAGLFPKSGLKTNMDTHVLVYYNDVAATTLSKVWGASGEMPSLENGEAQFSEGSIIVKPAFTTAGGNDWPPIAGAFPWEIWIADDPPSLTTVYLFQFDIIVKDKQSAPNTGWVFSTLIYDKDAPGPTIWDKMIPLGAMWGNDPGVITPEGCDPLFPDTCSPLLETWVDQSTPVYARETLGWGGRLSGPNDGAVDIDARIKSGDGSVPYRGRYAMSSCMGCHGSAEFPMKSFLVPMPSTCANESCSPKGFYYEAGSPEFMNWFQNRAGDVPQDPETTALDYGMNLSFKVLPAWYEATHGQTGPPPNQVGGDGSYSGLSPAK